MKSKSSIAGKVLENLIEKRSKITIDREIV